MRDSGHNWLKIRTAVGMLRVKLESPSAEHAQTACKEQRREALVSYAGNRAWKRGMDRDIYPC